MPVSPDTASRQPSPFGFFLRRWRHPEARRRGWHRKCCSKPPPRVDDGKVWVCDDCARLRERGQVFSYNHIPKDDKSVHLALKFAAGWVGICHVVKDLGDGWLCALPYIHARKRTDPEFRVRQVRIWRGGDNFRSWEWG